MDSETRSKSLLDGLEVELLHYTKPIHIGPSVVVRSKSDYDGPMGYPVLVSHRVTLTLGVELVYSSDEPEMVKHNVKNIRNHLANQLYGNLKAVVYEAIQSAHEHDMNAVLRKLDEALELMQ